MRIEAIIPKMIFNTSVFQRLAAAQAGAVALAVKRDFESTTKTWDHSVEFTMEYSAQEITVGTDDELYALVNNGASSHTITPRRARSLVFQPGYKAKTSPGVIGSKSGGKSGDPIQVPSVSHPGFQARAFDEAIAKKHDLDFGDAIDKAIAQANI